MKKVLQIALALGFGFFALTSVANAQQAPTCAIDNTGPVSVNVCTNTVQKECTILNETQITFENDSDQYTLSGDATAVDNTQTYGSATGSASNTNTTVADINITNGEDGDVCFANVTTRTVTPVVPGAETPAPAVTTPPVVKTLPKTNGTSPAVFAGATVAVLLGAVVASRFGLVAYNKLKG